MAIEQWTNEHQLRYFDPVPIFFRDFKARFVLILEICSVYILFITIYYETYFPQYKLYIFQIRNKRVFKIIQNIQCAPFKITNLMLICQLFNSHLLIFVINSLDTSD